MIALKRNIIIAGLIVLIILSQVYLAGSLYYSDKFSERTYINEVKVGGMTIEEAAEELMAEGGWKKTKITTDKKFLQEIGADEIGYKYLGISGLEKVFEQENMWEWFSSIFNDSKHTITMISEYNEEKIKEKIDEIEELDKKLLDARIVYSDNSNGFIIKPHSHEIDITKKELFNLIVEAIETGDSEVNLEEYIKQPRLYVDDEQLILAKDKANKYLDFEIRYDFGDREELIDHSVLKDFIVFEETEMKIDPEKVKEYVVGLARSYDTFGGTRNFHTSRGENKLVSGGSYGWLIHRNKTTEELIEHLKNGKNITIEPVYSYKGVTRNSNDVGNSYVEIDLEEQMVYVYLEGELKIKTKTVTGNLLQGYATPTGVYPINYKEREATLSGEDYDSPVDYWMPFNGHIGLHDANWRTKFGGDIYKQNGSHGCINLPPSNAKIVFELVYPGMPVVVH